MKKIVALVLCLVMVIGLMTGCQKAMDVKTLVQKMDEAAKGQTDMAAKLNMELEMTMGVTGMTMTMGVNADMDMKVNEEAIYMNMDAVMEMLGESQELTMEIYGLMEDDAMTMYMYEGSTDTWVKSVEEQFAGETETLQNSITINMSEIPEEKMTLAEEKQLVGDKECYILTVDLDGTYFADVMQTVMGMGTEELDEESKALLENLDWSALNAKTVYSVDAETFIPVKMTGEILGMGQVMNSMLGGLMSDMMGMLGGEEMEFTIDVPVFRIAMSDVAYGDVQVPAVPQEAIDNAIDADAMMEDTYLGGDPYVEESLLNNPAREDGSYLLTFEGDSVSVMPPEGFIPAMSEQEGLSLMTPDYTSSISYAMMTEITDEYMREYVGEMLDYAHDGEYYLSHTEPAELNGFTVATQLYNDDTGAVFAWKQLDATMLIVEVYFTGAAFDTEALLSGVEVIAE